MIQVIRASQRHFNDFGWLKTHWLFSFHDYYDPHNIRFGPLRIFNDDVIDPGWGFPEHQHREMEVIGLVMDGEITHRDDKGNTGVLETGGVLGMSAGTGMMHTEFNTGDRPARFYQMCFDPDQRGLEPTSDLRSFDASQWRNRLLPVASGQGLPDVINLHSDSTVYRGRFSSGEGTAYEIGDTRRVFVYVRSGQLNFNDTRVYEGDQARIDLERKLELESYGATEFVLIDVPSPKGWGIDEAMLKGARVEDLMRR